MKKRIFFAGLAMVISCFLSGGFGAMAAEFPTKPINFIMAHAPGGGTDLLGRPLATAACKSLGVPVVLENKSGGGGTLGPQLISSKAPDGYTLGNMLNSTLIAYRMGKLTFNPLTDLTYINTYAVMLQGVAVRADSPWKTMQELIEFSKKNPGKVSYGSSGVGTTAHIPMEYLSIMAGGIKWKHVPYDGSASLIPALLGSHVDFISCASSGWINLVLAGQFRLLATFGTKRSERFPQVPTLKEIGYDVAPYATNVIIGPKGMPKPIVNKLNDVFMKAMDDPDYLTAVKNLDYERLVENPEETLQDIKRDFDYYGIVLEKLGMKKK